MRKKEEKEFNKINQLPYQSTWKAFKKLTVKCVARACYKTLLLEDLQFVSAQPLKANHFRQGLRSLESKIYLKNTDMCINNKSNGSIHTLARARVKWLKQDTGSPLSRFRSTKESERSVLNARKSFSWKRNKLALITK